MIYVDTSVLVAALTREAQTDRVQHWLAGQSAGALAISPWVVAEFSAALSIKLRTRALQADERASVLTAFRSLTSTAFVRLPIESADFEVAAALADHAGLGLRAGDALHLAILGRLDCTLATLDQTLANAARDVGSRIESIG
jgi:hypothetical protein